MPQAGLEIQHILLRGGLERGPGKGIEGDEVHLNPQSLYQSG